MGGWVKLHRSIVDNWVWVRYVARRYGRGAERGPGDVS